MSEYGALPKDLGIFPADCREFMFYQYLPVKLSGQTWLAVEKRLNCFDAIIGTVACDYVGLRGLDAFVAANIYITAKRMYHAPECPMNRPGWHSDGFLTDDINYIWADCAPTEFNKSVFKLTLDDEVSLREMTHQAHPKNNVAYADRALLRLDQFSIHRVATVHEPMLRAFLKVSFSPDRYDLLGNSHNHLLDYDWPMYERKQFRNIPQAASAQQHRADP